MLNLHRTAAIDTCGTMTAGNLDHVVSTRMVFEARAGPNELRTTFDIDSDEFWQQRTRGITTVLEAARNRDQAGPSRLPAAERGEFEAV